MSIGLGVIIAIALGGLALLATAVFGGSTGNGAEDAMGRAILSVLACGVLVVDSIAFIIWLAIN